MINFIGNHQEITCPNCGHMVMATEEDVQAGFTCIRCNKRVIQPEGCEEPILLEEYEKEQARKAEEEAEKAAQEAKALEALKEAAQGKEESKPEGETEGVEGDADDAEQSKLVDGLHAVCPGCAFETEIQYPNKMIVQCESCQKYFQKPHDPEHDSEKSGLLDDDRLPNEHHLELLKELNFCGKPETARDATNILLVIRDTIEKGIRDTYPSYRFLPLDIRRSIICKFANSPFFSQMYFKQKKYSERELDMILTTAVPDSELLSASKISLSTAKFEEAVRYVNEFMQYNFGFPLDRDVPEMLVLKAFLRGFGKSLKTYEKIKQEDKTAKTAQPKTAADLEKEKTAFYCRKTPAHAQLEYLLNDNGYKRKKELPTPDAGCLAMVIMMLCAFFAIKYISHC